MLVFSISGAKGEEDARGVDGLRWWGEVGLEGECEFIHHSKSHYLVDEYSLDDGNIVFDGFSWIEEVVQSRLYASEKEHS